MNFFGEEQEVKVSEFKINPEFSNKINDVMLPLLDLNLGETNKKPRGETERLNNSHAHKFIPMRTQRVNNNKSTYLQTTKGSSIADDNSPPIVHNKKFIRKGDLPLTTGRRDVTKIGLVSPDIELHKTDSL